MSNGTLKLSRVPMLSSVAKVLATLPPMFTPTIFKNPDPRKIKVCPIVAVVIPLASLINGGCTIPNVAPEDDDMPPGALMLIGPDKAGGTTNVKRVDDRTLIDGTGTPPMLILTAPGTKFAPETDTTSPGEGRSGVKPETIGGGMT